MKFKAVISTVVSIAIIFSFVPSAFAASSKNPLPQISSYAQKLRELEQLLQRELRENDQKTAAVKKELDMIKKVISSNSKK